MEFFLLRNTAVPYTNQIAHHISVYGAIFSRDFRFRIVDWIRVSTNKRWHIVQRRIKEREKSYNKTTPTVWRFGMVKFQNTVCMYRLMASKTN